MPPSEALKLILTRQRIEANGVLVSGLQAAYLASRPLAFLIPEP